MGTTLYLDIPEERKTEELLYNYYEYKLGKKAQITGEEPPSIEEYNIYNRKLERLEEEGDIWISEKVTSTIAKGIDMNKIREIFSISRTGGYDSPVINGEEIEQVVDILRAGKPRLEEIKPVADWELTLEGNQIALCEFALENELGIGLSM